MFDVITFGSAVVDVFVYTDLAEKAGHVCYDVGSKILINDLKFDVGGGGTNTAVAFSRLGFRTGYLGKIGNDANGQKILDLLEKEEVKFLGKKEEDLATGYSIVLDSRAKDRTILTYKGANDHMKWDELSPGQLVTRWLYLSSLLKDSFETQKRLAEYLHKRGAKIAFNPSEYLIRKEDVRPILKLCEILVLNKEESELLVGEKDTLERLHDKGPKIVVITDRDNPIRAYDGYKKYSLKPHKIRVVERTGAGDAFASGFTAGQIIGKDIDWSLRFGLRESEAVITHFGAKNNLIRMNLRRR